MRIVHAVSNVAGVPQLLASVQRSQGYQATAVLYPTVHGPVAGAINLDELLAGNRVTRKLRRARTIAWLAQTYDVFHFHFHTTFANGHQDLTLLKALGKKIVFHLHGCDIRDPRRARVEHPLSACTECTFNCMVPVKLRLPEVLRRFADAVVVSTPDLLEYVDGAVYIPNPVDLAPWEALRKEQMVTRNSDDDLVVVHAPTNREIKGTRHIVAAIERLQGEGLPFQLRIYEGIAQEELRRLYATADLAIDQLMVGWFGVFAIELMALGIPVVARIREDLQGIHPDLPIEHADPTTLTETLRKLLLSPDRRADLAERGPAYVRAHHNPATISQQFLELYERL